MKTVNIAELKNTLSEQLRRVRKGERILIADRNVVIARLEPATAHDSDDDDARIASLEARGILRLGVGRVSLRELSKSRAVKADTLAALLRDREDDR